MTERRNHRWFWLQLTIGAVRLHPHAEPGGTGTSTGLSVWLYLDMSSWKISEAIRGNRNKSEAIRHELVEDLRGNPRQSEAIRGNQRYLAASSRQSEAISGNQRQSAVPRRELEAVSGNQRYLAASSRQSEAISGNQRQSAVPRRELEAVRVHGCPAVVDAGEEAEAHPRDEQPEGDDEERRHQRNDEERTLNARMRE